MAIPVYKIPFCTSNKEPWKAAVWESIVDKITPSLPRYWNNTSIDALRDEILVLKFGVCIIVKKVLLNVI